MRLIRLRAERLEDRTTPAGFGTPWPDAENLTLSFAPDGTDVGGNPSQLAAHLDAEDAAWRSAMVRAFQTWAVHANVNFGLVGDSGEAFGSPGAPQGRSDVGDIRIGAVQLSDSELIIASPFDWFSGWSGDVLVNTDTSFTAGPGGVDLYTAMLHEVGHTLGLSHSENPDSVMYPTYMGPRSGLSAEDVSRLQELYSARTGDDAEGLFGNNTKSRATSIAYIDHSSELDDVVRADLTTSADVDFYKIRTPLGGGSFSAVVRTSGLSLLTPRVEVFNSSGQLVTSDVSTDPLNGDVSVTVNGAGWWQTYYVKVSGATNDVFGTGAYELAVGPLAHEAAYPDEPRIMADVAGLDLPWMVTGLLETTLTVGDHWEYSGHASFDRVGDVDTFWLSPPLGAHDQAMVLTAWGLDGNAVQPRIQVFGLLGNEIETELISDNGGVFTIQIAEGVGGLLDKYFVRIEADPDAPEQVGNYFLGVDFRSDPVALDVLAQGELTPADPVELYSLNISRDGLRHFVLDVDGTGGAVAFDLFNADRELVYSLTVSAGMTHSGDVVLEEGTYTVRLRSTVEQESLTFLLRGTERTDPIGPQPTDTTGDPSDSPADHPPHDPDPAGDDPTFEEPSEPEDPPAEEPEPDPYPEDPSEPDDPSTEEPEPDPYPEEPTEPEVPPEEEPEPDPYPEEPTEPEEPPTTEEHEEDVWDEYSEEEEEDWLDPEEPASDPWDGY